MFLSLHSKNFNAKIKKCFIKPFPNVQYASPWLHSTHQKGIPFLAKLKQAYRDRWLSRSQLSKSSDHPLMLEEEEECRPNFLHSPREKIHMELGLEI